MSEMEDRLKKILARLDKHGEDIEQKLRDLKNDVRSLTIELRKQIEEIRNMRNG